MAEPSGASHSFVRSSMIPRFETPGAADLAVWCSFAAGIAHLATVQAHYRWWPAAGLFFAVVGIAQLLTGVLLLNVRVGPRIARPLAASTAALIVLYVVSRTRGLPFGPGIVAHGAKPAPGRPIIPGAVEELGVVDLVALVAEIGVVMCLLAALPAQQRRRPLNALCVVGAALFVSAAVGEL